MKLNQIYDITRNYSNNLIFTIIPFSQDLYTYINKPKYYEILSRRFGFRDNKTYTLEEIATYYKVSKESIRQLETKALIKIRDCLNIISDSPSKLVKEYQEIKVTLFKVGLIITEQQVIEHFKNEYNNDLTSVNLPSLRFLLTLLNFEKLKDPNPKGDIEFTGSWLLDTSINKEEFYKSQIKINSILSKSDQPLSFFELVVKVNKGLKNPVSNELIALCIKTLNQVEEVNQNCFQLKFESLKSIADKAYRILLEKNESMRLVEIHQELLHRITETKESSKIPIRSISSQLTSDNRFSPIGKSFWALKEWRELSTGSGIELIQEFFYLKNAESTVEEILEYVQRKRSDISRKTIQTYLSKKDKFTKVSENSYALHSWNRKEYQPKSLNQKTRSGKVRECLQNAVLHYLSALGCDWIRLSELKSYVMKICECGSSTFYRYINEIPQVIKESRVDGDFCKLIRQPEKEVEGIIRQDWEKIIEGDETAVVEFKIAAKWNRFKKQPDGSMSQKIVKEVAGFMNSDSSGMILIGIDDDTHEIIGIEDDIKVADPKKPNHDGYLLFLSNTISNSLGRDLSLEFSIDFHMVKGKEICCITVNPASRIVYYDDHIYLRGINQSNQLTGREAIDFKAKRDKQFRSLGKID